MNYIKELNAMYHLCMSKKLAKLEIALLYALYAINNAEDWAVWFEADNELVSRLTGGYSREAINETRNKLKQMGRIDFIDGVKNKKPPKYKIISLCQVTSKVDIPLDVQVDIQVDKVVDIPLDVQVDHSFKLKQNKTKTKDIESKKEGTATPKRPKHNFQQLIDNFTDNEVLKNTLWEYIKMRINKKAKPTDHALDLALKHLRDLSSDTEVQIAILEKSIVNNWTDIFPIRNQIDDSTKKTIKNTIKPNRFANFNQRQYDPEDVQRLQRAYLNKDSEGSE